MSWVDAAAPGGQWQDNAQPTGDWKDGDDWILSNPCGFWNDLLLWVDLAYWLDSCGDDQWTDSAGSPPAGDWTDAAAPSGSWLDANI